MFFNSYFSSCGHSSQTQCSNFKLWGFKIINMWYILDYYWDQMAYPGYRTYYIRTMTCFDNPWSKMTLHKFFGFVQKCLDNIFQNWGFWCANAALQVELCRLAVQPETLQEPAKGRWNKRGRGFPPGIPPHILAGIEAKSLLLAQLKQTNQWALMCKDIIQVG